MAVYSSAKEYDLKASEDSIGQLRPIILSKDGSVAHALVAKYLEENQK